MADPIGQVVLFSVPDDESAIAEDGGLLFQPIIRRGLIVGRSGRVPTLVQTDPDAPRRTREHVDLVSAILNSLIMQEQLIRVPGETARGIWRIGYSPANPSAWGDVAPTTIGEAIDILIGLANMDKYTRVGHGPPPVGLGNPGDTYVDIDTGSFYWNL